MNIFLVTELNIKGNGKESRDMGMDHRFGLMELVMKGIGRKIKLMGRGLSGM